jgi:SAM-dependent methyltransferase
MKQVNKSHYIEGGYSFPGRWVSYFHQLNEVLSASPKTVLEIGVGDKVFGGFLKNNTNILYTSLDVAEDLKPDIVGDARNLPFANRSQDVVCAFEVLEHLPYEESLNVLREMKRVASNLVIVSVPHFGPAIKFSLKIPFFPEIRISCKIFWPRKHVFNGQHYWELGKRGFSVKRFKNDLTRIFTIQSDFVPFENQYHHFFILK